MNALVAAMTKETPLITRLALDARRATALLAEASPAAKNKALKSAAKAIRTFGPLHRIAFRLGNRSEKHGTEHRIPCN